uniref:Uncharacterized protein n=1 Tax=Romanomermis culicivorax TaxID=13658 RepID=A0A915IA28_ROMCU
MARQYYYKLTSAYVPANDNESHWREQFAQYCPPSSKEKVTPPIDFVGLTSCLLESIVSEATATFASKDSTCLDACIEVNPVSSVMTKRKLTTAYILYELRDTLLGTIPVQFKSCKKENKDASSTMPTD